MYQITLYVLQNPLWDVVLGVLVVVMVVYAVRWLLEFIPFV